MGGLKQAESLLRHLIARYNEIAGEPFELEPEEKPPKCGGVSIAIDGKSGRSFMIVPGKKGE